MSDEFSSVPNILFKSLKNTELGAESVRRDEDGSVLVTGVLKKVTESMLQSYPRNKLGKWTHNRLSVRFTAEDAKTRDWKRHDNGEALDLDGVLAL